MLAGWPVADMDCLRAMQAKIMLTGELRCSHHAGVRHRAMLPRSNASIVPEIPRVNRTTIFKTRPHITKGFHLNDGLASNPAQRKGVLPKLSVTSLSKLKSQDFNALHLPKPLKKGLSTNSFDSRLPGKSLMSTAQYYELKKIYGEKPVERLDRLLCRNKRKSKCAKKGRGESCPLQRVQIGGTCPPPRQNSPESIDSPDDLEVSRKLDTELLESVDDEDGNVLLLTPGNTIQCPVNTQGSATPSNIHLAPLKVREIQHPSPGANTIKLKAEALQDFMTSNIEHALWLHQRDLRMSPAILTDSPKILSPLSCHLQLPGLVNRPSPLGSSCHHFHSDSQGDLFPKESLTPVTARPTPVSTLEQNKSVTGSHRLRPQFINVGPDIPAELKVVGNKPKAMSKLLGHIRKARRSSDKNHHGDAVNDKFSGGKKKSDLKIKGTQMKHKANSHLLNYLNYSRDYRLGHVIHPGASCDRMESHWIANDLQTLSQQKLGKGLLPADWGFGEEEDETSIKTRLTSSPVHPGETNHIHMLCGSNSADEMWLRNISMIMACSSCSSSDMDTFSSGSASASSSVSVTTSTPDFFSSLLTSHIQEMAIKNLVKEHVDETKEREKARCASKGAMFSTTSDATVTQTCSSAASDPARANSQTSAALSGTQHPPTTPASPPGTVSQHGPRLPNLQQKQTSHPPAKIGRTDWHSISLSQGPLASIVLKHSAKGKVVPSLRVQNKPEVYPVSKRSFTATHEKRGKVWRRKKRVPKVESRSVCGDEDTEGLSLTAPTNWKKSGLLCFAPMYDARYDQWKRRRVRHKDMSGETNLKRNQLDKSEGEESEGCSDSDESELWPSAGASTTVDPRSSSSGSEPEATDVVSSVPLSPEPKEDIEKRSSGHESQEVPDNKISEKAELSLQEQSGSKTIDKTEECVIRKSDDKHPTKGLSFEIKSSKMACRLPSVPEQDTAECKEETASADKVSADDQPLQRENLAKKLKAIFKRKPTSTVDVPETGRVLPKESRVSSAPGRTSIWLTESLAVSSIGPPPSSELTSLRTPQTGAAEKGKKKVERPDKCSRSEKPTKKVTLQEILRFLPNIGVTSQEPAKECSHDLTKVLPSGRRADVTLCQSCICKMAMAQTALKNTSAGAKPAESESTGLASYLDPGNNQETNIIQSAVTVPTCATVKNIPPVSQSTSEFKPPPVVIPKTLATTNLSVHQNQLTNGTGESLPSANNAEPIKTSIPLSVLPEIRPTHLPEIKCMNSQAKKDDECQGNENIPVNEINDIIPENIADKE